MSLCPTGSKIGGSYYKMNAPLPKKIAITLNPLYGFIYGGITAFLLVVALIISSYKVAGLSLLDWIPSEGQSYIDTNLKPVTTKPVTFIFNPFVCTFKKISGLPCMTCGGTRSLFHFAHLRLKDSFSMNPFVFLIITAMLLYGLVSVISLLIPRDHFDDSNNKKEFEIIIPRWSKRILIILLVGGFLINWAYLIFIGKP